MTKLGAAQHGVSTPEPREPVRALALSSPHVWKPSLNRNCCVMLATGSHPLTSPSHDHGVTAGDHALSHTGSARLASRE
jgi:hypothetical protein